ncbi:hypothetical protein L0222_24235 [bacterium]|nr:hypothetical protein [bacterium]
MSPDGRWLAYVSDESGNQEVYVRPFPSLDRKWQISSSGGNAPHWRDDGREILFLGPDLSVQTAEIKIENDKLEASSPVLLFTSKRPLLALASSPDHNRSLVSVVPGDARSEPIRMMLGWQQ